MEQVYLVLSAQVWWQILLQIYNYPWSYNSPHLHTILLEPISAPNKSPAVKSGPGSSLTSSPFANCTPEGKVICRNFNRVKGCNLLESSFAHVCNRKINGRACTQPHPSCNHHGSRRVVPLTHPLPWVPNDNPMACHLPSTLIFGWQNYAVTKIMNFSSKAFAMGSNWPLLICSSLRYHVQITNQLQMPLLKQQSSRLLLAKSLRAIMLLAELNP